MSNEYEDEGLVSPDHIEMLAPEELLPYDDNANTHTPDQVDQIVNSIEEFGFTNPLIIDEDDGIMAGHGRYLAAKHMGLDAIPCVRLSHLTAEQKRAYIIADNQIARNSEWDEELLTKELEYLDNEEFDLDLLGFDEETLNALIGEEEEESDKKERKKPPKIKVTHTCPACGHEFSND